MSRASRCCPAALATTEDRRPLPRVGQDHWQPRSWMGEEGPKGLGSEHVDRGVVRIHGCARRERVRDPPDDSARVDSSQQRQGGEQDEQEGQPVCARLGRVVDEEWAEGHERRGDQPGGPSHRPDAEHVGQGDSCEACEQRGESQELSVVAQAIGDSGQQEEEGRAQIAGRRLPLEEVDDLAEAVIGDDPVSRELVAEERVVK